MAIEPANVIHIDKDIHVQEDAPVGGDLIFMSTNYTGNPGELNRYVLTALGLDTSAMPNEKELVAGYHVRAAGDSLLCFIVTLGERGTVNENLESNLENALRDERLSKVSRVWLPLMGTGAGKLPAHRSFRTILAVLRRTGWAKTSSREVTISLPYNLPEPDREKLRAAVEGAAGIKVASHDLPLSIPDGPPASPAAVMLLAFAAGLKSLRRERGGSLSTSLVLYALAEVTSDRAPALLREDPATVFMGNAIRDRADYRYAGAWSEYFEHSRDSVTLPAPAQIPKWTSNVGQILTSAHAKAVAAGRTEVETDDIIEAMFELPKGRYNLSLEKLGVSREMLIEDYRDMARGQVLMSLHNDVASDADKLGYQVYADAIAQFLTDTATPPPLSISIQAPWGAGKSSLMHMIREKLDPRVERDQYRAKPGIREAARLTIRDVLRFIDGTTAKPIKAFLGLNSLRTHEDVNPATVELVNPGRRLTIWFNAWKYETSEQVWAGLVDAIVSQISGRLPPIEREKFLLRLQLARIDDGIIRRKIYDRVVTLWWGRVRELVGIVGGWIAAMLGLAAAPKVIDAENPAIKGALGVLKAIGYPGAWIGGVFLAVALVRQFFMASQETKDEPATFSLADYIRVPDYGTALGQLHQIHGDLHRVLGVTPSTTINGLIVQEPVVIFIDDLDRCTPGKIAAVVEGVSLLLADDTYRCMFVIGMDPQMVAAALEKAHEDVRDQLPSYERAVPLGWRFMDKFVQLPFTIPPSRQDKLDALLASMGGALPEPEVSAPVEEVDSPEPDVDITTEAPGSTADDVDTAISAPSPPTAKPATVVEAVAASGREARDVGKIIRLVSGYTAGNPREVKRMVNLARLYLHLRNARRRAEPRWRSPSLDQYARWIALTLRWPDMMRWLQWGVDEAAWSPAEMSQLLIVRRLEALQASAADMKTGKEWSETLKIRLEFSDVDKVDWAADSKLMEFFRNETNRGDDTISAAAARGFW
jgi:hypothetical protein